MAENYNSEIIKEVYVTDRIITPPLLVQLHFQTDLSTGVAVNAPQKAIGISWTFFFISFFGLAMILWQYFWVQSMNNFKIDP